MAKAEKVIFLLLVALLVLGVGVKFYKLKEEKTDFTLAREVRPLEPAPRVQKEAKSPAKKKLPVPEFVNVNSSTAEEIAALPHIGKTLAQKIVDYRAQHGPFLKKTDLLRVDGVSISLYKKLENSLRLK